MRTQFKKLHFRLFTKRHGIIIIREVYLERSEIWVKNTIDILGQNILEHRTRFTSLNVQHHLKRQEQQNLNTLCI